MLDSLISYWPLGEASGNALDAHGSNHLTETSGTIDSATGKVGNCRDFEAGDTEYFTLADNADLSCGDIDFSIAAWVNAESLTGTHDIVSKDDGGATQREYILGYASSRFRFGVFTGSGTFTQKLADSLGAPSTGTWYLVIGWHDSVNNTLNIQVNNGTVDSQAYSNGLADEAAPFCIGARGSGGAGSAHWDGLIDEVAFAKRVWTSDERTWIYNSGNGRSYADWAATAGGTRGMPFGHRGTAFNGGRIFKGAIA